MLVQVSQNALVVIRADDDPAYKSETAFWHALKKYLNDWHGQDLIKKVMSKDGHLVGGDTYPYYLRDREWAYCIHDGNYAIREVHKDFNKERRVRLSVVRWSDKSRGKMLVDGGTLLPPPASR